MAPINILLTGATGYIGGSVLSALLHHPRLDEFNVTALVRSDAKASRLQEVAVAAVVGSYEDPTLLKKLASQADVVIACASADNLGGTKAILAGLKQRYRNTATTPILIHTSGIGVLVDDAQGDYASDKIYSDFDVHQLECLPRTQPHREVDIAVTDASEEEYVKTCIVYPGLVYGIARTRLVTLGVQNSHSQQITSMINAGIDRHQGGVVGQGRNMWSHVHIEDLACLYMHIFDAAVSRCRLYVGRIGMYFAENGECEVGEIFQEVSKELSARRCGGSRPTVFAEAEKQKFIFARMLGGNARARAERARSIGWRPVHGMQTLLASIREEVTALLDTRDASL